MPSHVALLRGINLASRRRVAMSDLRELAQDLGYEDVRTHLQSGNLVLRSESSADTIARELERAIVARLKLEVQVVVRTRGELAGVIERNPLADIVTDPKRYQVSFLSAEPAPAAIRELATEDIAPEQFVHIGREIYAWHPAGLQSSQLARLLSDKRLGVAVTARNWNTITRLLELADA